jgi:hypothetical protein
MCIERRGSVYVIRGKSGFKIFSTEPATYGQEVKYKTKDKAKNALDQVKGSLPFEEFEIIEV